MEKEVSVSKFYMIRCLIAMAHADGIIDEKEIAYISAMVNRLPLTEEQHGIIEDDFDNAKDVYDLLRYINDPVFRGQLPYFARVLAFKDGHLHPTEQELLDKLHANALEGVDMEEIKKNVRHAVQAEMTLHDISIDNDRPRKGEHFIPWFQLFDEWLLSMGIDLMRG